MSRRKFARPAVAAVAVVVAAAVAVPALAGAPRNTTVKPIGTVKMVPNRSITDGMHFNRDAVTIQTGGKVTLIDETKAPHSWSIVKRRQVPGTLRFNAPGDFVLIPPDGRTSVKITAAPGSTLNMICAIHPWMQNKVNVVRQAG